jgi:hypothetical protein
MAAAARTVLSIDVALRTLAYAVVTFPSEGNARLEALDSVDLLALAGVPGKVTTTAGEDLVAAVERAMPSLLGVWSSFPLTEVVIERQPATNAKMRMVACAIATMLRTAWALASHDPSLPPPTVAFQAPALQRRAYPPASEEEAREPPTASQRYAAKKAAAVAAAQSLLATHADEWPAHLAERFETTTKRDDMADALLQAFAWHLLHPEAQPGPRRHVPADTLPHFRIADVPQAKGKKRKRVEA